jgi:hypothetical protein
MAQHTFHPIDQKLIAELIAAEIAAGRHTAAPTQLCCDCGRFVHAIYHLEGRKCWCGPCADKFGQGPQSILRRQQQQAARARGHHRTEQSGRGVIPIRSHTRR